MTTFRPPELFSILGIYSLLSLAVYCAFPKEIDVYIADSAASANIAEAAAEIEARILLTGDTGATVTEPLVVKNLAQLAASLPEITTTVLLGDNVYPSGIPHHQDPAFAEKVAVLHDQLRLLKESGAAYFITPGNHDWGSRAEPGRETLLRQIEVLDKVAGEKGLMQPRDACPGPDEVVLNSKLRLIFFDMQPLLTGIDIPASCAVRSIADIALQFSRIATDDPALKTIFIQHHPLRSHAPHAGEYSASEHLFPLRHINKWLYLPLPLLGTLHLSATHRSSCPQHLGCSTYQQISTALKQALKPIKPIACAAGHDHTLQVLAGDEACGHYLVSGTGSKLDFVTHGSDTWFAASLPGFMRLDRYRDGRYLLAVHVVGEESKVVYRKWLK